MAYSTHEDHGFWASVKNAFLPDEDRHTHEEGVRRGGAELTTDVDNDDVAQAVKFLEDAGLVDIDASASQWRQSGWDYPAGAAATTETAGSSAFTGFGEHDANEDRATHDLTERATDARSHSGDRGGTGGTRDVSPGSVNARSYVTKTTVGLRHERVDVQRRPVDRDVSGSKDAFREHTIDITATGEEAVVGKTQRVVEEVVVSKTADCHVEQIDHTVRRTDVKVDRDGGSTDLGSTSGTTPGR